MYKFFVKIRMTGTQTGSSEWVNGDSFYINTDGTLVINSKTHGNVRAFAPGRWIEVGISQ
jgi:hypothetical protein